MSRNRERAEAKKKIRRVLAAVLIVALVLVAALCGWLILRLMQEKDLPQPPEPTGTTIEALPETQEREDEEIVVEGEGEEPAPAPTEDPGQTAPTETPAEAIPETSTETTSETAPAELPEEYLGDWEKVDEPYSTVRLTRDENGDAWLSASFYRLVGFDAVYRGERDEDGRLVFRSELDDFTCLVLLQDDAFSMYVETTFLYRETFGRENEHVYRRAEPAEGGWLGRWQSENGETLEIYEQRADCICLTYTGRTASGESSFTSYYTMYFEDEDQLIAGEDAAVEKSAGWRYRLELDGDVIIMHSRYPDRLFYRQS